MDRTRLKLYFKDQANSSKTITIENIKANYTDDEVRTAMDQMIESGVLQTKKGKVNQKSKAFLEIVKENNYDIGIAE